MKFFTRTGKPMSKVITDQASKVGTDEVSRREFIAMASTFGATAATAYGMLGMAAPAHADGHGPRWVVRCVSSRKSARSKTRAHMTGHRSRTSRAVGWNIW